MALDDPILIVAVSEFQEGPAQFFGISERPEPEEVFFEDPDKAFNAAVALRRPDEGRRTVDPQEGDFRLEIMGRLKLSCGKNDSTNSPEKVFFFTDFWHTTPFEQINAEKICIVTVFIPRWYLEYL
jgi:hypothetical protein